MQRGTGWITCWGTKILHATVHQKKNCQVQRNPAHLQATGSPHFLWDCISVYSHQQATGGFPTFPHIPHILASSYQTLIFAFLIICCHFKIFPGLLNMAEISHTDHFRTFLEWSVLIFCSFSTLWITYSLHCSFMQVDSSFVAHRDCRYVICLCGLSLLWSHLWCMINTNLVKWPSLSFVICIFCYP